jgi:hypothetical protein
MALTDIAVRTAKFGAKAIRLADAVCVFLLIQATVGKVGRLKYRIEGREKLRDIRCAPAYKQWICSSNLQSV